MTGVPPVLSYTVLNDLTDDPISLIALAFHGHENILASRCLERERAKMCQKIHRFSARCLLIFLERVKGIEPSS